MATIEEKEKQVRANETKNPISLLLLGNLAAFKVMAFYLISLETVITCALTAGLVVHWYKVGLQQDKVDSNSTLAWTASSMDFIVLAFAVTRPVRTFPLHVMYATSGRFFR